MPIFQREIPDLQEAFAEDQDLKQMVLGLEFYEGEAEGAAAEAEDARMRAEAARQSLEKSYGTQEAPAWLTEYYLLREKGWPFRQAAYIAWASTPSPRSPNTQQELALLLGLSSDRAISTWRKRNPAIIETIAILQSTPLWRHRADAFNNLIEGMQRSGTDYKFFNHLKLYLEMTGDYIPTSEFIANLKKKISTDPSDLSDEEIGLLKRAFDDYEAKNAEGAAAEEG